MQGKRGSTPEVRLVASCRSVQTLTVTAGDQITSAGYGHDASGNLTAAPSVGSSVAYNGAEQMTARTTSGGSAGYTYAGTDQVELIAQSGGRNYTYGRSNGAGVPIIESYPAGSTTTSYTYDPQGTPLAVEGANSHYLALDGLGSPVALVNQDGGQTGAYAYDPYGGMTATAVNGSGAIGIQLYGYAGGFDDPASGLVHFGQRWYDPATGRFTQPDNLEVLADPTRANRYEYAASNSTNFVDPTGKEPIGPGACQVGGFFGSLAAFLLRNRVLSGAGLAFGAGALATNCGRGYGSGHQPPPTPTADANGCFINSSTGGYECPGRR